MQRRQRPTQLPGGWPLSSAFGPWRKLSRGLGCTRPAPSNRWSLAFYIGAEIVFGRSIRGGAYANGL
eukprot:5282416-Alexandrium_andersonii.AAC.1